MASLSHDKQNNRWRIQFVAPDGSRRSVSTKGGNGKDKGRSKAETFKGRIEELLSAKLTGTAIPRAVAVWIADLPNETYCKLSNAGLVEPRLSEKLGPFLQGWFAERQGQKQSTLTVWGHTRRNLRDFFGDENNLRDITEDDADRFERWLKTNQKLAESTIRKRCGFAKQFLESAVRARLLDRNPLQRLKSAAKGNKKRQYFVPEADSRKVLEACPDAEWRVMFALARYGALRCPSEVMALRWCDINWADNRFLVHASKTEHHEDNGERVTPLFPAVRKALDELWDQPGEKSEYVIERYRNHTNLGTQLARIIRNAGLKPWPKLWQNLRATRATELVRNHPQHVVTSWCGHTETIAAEHYWMTTEDDFAKAAVMGSGAYLVQQGVATEGKPLKFEETAQKESPEKPGSAKSCTVVRTTPLEDKALLQSQFDLLSRLLNATEMRQKVIGQNIANVNTPGYRRLEVNFEAALAEEITRSRPTSPRQQATPQLAHTAGLAKRADGNNVDMDMEIGQMNKNALLQQVYMQVMGAEMGMMRKAIDGG